MDFFAASVANHLVGNDRKQPVIEMHFPAAEILFETNELISITGANFDANINDAAIEMHQPFFVKKNSILTFKKNSSGARVYLAIGGTMVAENWLGSYSTHLKVKAGGFKGRLLQKDDTIETAACTAKINSNKISVSPTILASVYNNKNIIRCIAGPEWNLVSTSSQNIFTENTFTITSRSDRMGYRLAGENLSLQNSIELISSPVSFGTIQLLPNGQLIILMADHQTTGGYPRIACVIAADLPKLAQLPINNAVHFEIVSIERAEEMLISLHQTLAEIKTGCQNFYDKH